MHAIISFTDKFTTYFLPFLIVCDENDFEKSEHIHE